MMLLMFAAARCHWQADRYRSILDSKYKLMWLLILPAIFFMLLLYVLFAPLVLEINTPEGLYRIRYHRLASAVLRIEDSSLIAYIRLPFWQKRIDLFEPRKNNKKQAIKQAPKTKKKKKRPFSFRRVSMLLHSFKIRKFFLALDTGNYMLNGMIYPFCPAKWIQVNFAGRNELILTVTNTGARILWAFIKSRSQ